MNQIHLKQSSFEALEELDDIIEEAKLELQKSMSMLHLDVNVEEAFTGVLEKINSIQEIAIRIEDKECRDLALEKITLYSMHFNEVVKQVPAQYQN